MINICDFIPDGKKNAISMADLAAATNLDTRTVRALVHNARSKGAVICSTCDNDNGGYYMPLDVSEAMPYYKQQLSRIRSANTALAAVAEYISAQGEDLHRITANHDIE